MISNGLGTRRNCDAVAVTDTVMMRNPLIGIRRNLITVPFKMARCSDRDRSALYRLRRMRSAPRPQHEHEHQSAQEREKATHYLSSSKKRWRRGGS